MTLTCGELRAFLADTAMYPDDMVVYIESVGDEPTEPASDMGRVELVVGAEPAWCVIYGSPDAEEDLGMGYGPD